jgi:hypothetical protein
MEMEMELIAGLAAGDVAVAVPAFLVAAYRIATQGPALGPLCYNNGITAVIFSVGGCCAPPLPFAPPASNFHCLVAVGI